jgi:hypothetical protein
MISDNPERCERASIFYSPTTKRKTQSNLFLTKEQGHDSLNSFLKVVGKNQQMKGGEY